jgi:leader peptidase (prepilin peptidase)/N-methyltransferase
MVPQWVFVAILLVATFVDLEHLIIPDEITWGGVVAGLVFSFGLPELHGVSGRAEGFAAALLGAFAGYGLLWGVVEGGRLLFGRKKISYAPPVEVVWTRNGEEAVLSVGEEEMVWGEFFFRGTERLQMKVMRSEVDGLALGPGEFQWGLNEVRMEGRVFDLNQVHQIRLGAEWIVFPREAMGFGDVKFLAAIGAFLGWKAVLFTVVAASTLGAIVGMLLLILRKHRSVIPFGPYLALGAFLWMAAGPLLVDAYWRWVGFAMAR